MLVTIIHSINYYSAEYLHHNDLGMTDASCQTDTIGTRNEVDDAKTDVMIQTALTKRTIEAMEEELQRQEEIIKELKKKASTPFDKDFFMSDDDRVLYYTGLPNFTTLSALIKVLDQAIPSSHSFTSFQQVVLCLNENEVEHTISRLESAFRCSPINSISHMFISSRCDACKVVSTDSLA